MRPGLGITLRRYPPIAAWRTSADQRRRRPEVPSLSSNSPVPRRARPESAAAWAQSKPHRIARGFGLKSNLACGVLKAWATASSAAVRNLPPCAQRWRGPLYRAVLRPAQDRACSKAMQAMVSTMTGFKPGLNRTVAPTELAAKRRGRRQRPFVTSSRLASER
jgi:hypothetical protein